MKTAYTLQHLHTLPGGEEDVKFIGVYSTQEKAVEAIGRLSQVAGFKDVPKLINPLEDENTDGFYIGTHEVDSDSWEEGFVA